LAKVLGKIVLLGGLCISSTVFAQQKIGIVDVQGVFQALPQAAGIQQQIADEFRDQIAEIEKMQKDLGYYGEKLKRDATTMSATEKSELEEQIIALQNEYQAKAGPLQQDVQRRNAEERNKILALIKTSVDTIAAEDDFDLILNANAIIFADESFNLSERVIKEAGKVKQ
jgi:outer membrane protein